jgi:REP element-mobilizing transposase RayT
MRIIQPMNSYRQIIYHIVFLTKKRRRSIEERYCHDLYRYIGGIIKNRNSIHYEINGAADHIHILSDLHPRGVAAIHFTADRRPESDFFSRS